MCKKFVAELFVMAKKKRKQNNLHVTKSKEYHMDSYLITQKFRSDDTVAISILFVGGFFVLFVFYYFLEV